ncbi:MAG: tetratricopeptide repeat protein [Candidatus Omnitrophota bacterium]
MKNYIPEISKLIRQKKIVVFYGAGISKNSGLPLANELAQLILKKLCINDTDKDEILNSALPFEAFIEIISRNTDVSSILEVFEKGEPNINHAFIAKMAKNRFIRIIVTTNFDLLIEKALEKEGLKRDKDFTVYYNENQFSKIDLADTKNKSIIILKIHGSIENKESIRVTMETIASETPSDPMAYLIRYLFLTGKHKKVLILGYSCSDEFDITPNIQDIVENPKKEIIFVEHSKEGIEIEDVRMKKWKNPFKAFRGERIKCNTDDFIRELWNFHRRSAGEYNLVEFDVDWETYVDCWAKKLKENKKYFIVGLIFYEISIFKKGIDYFEKSLLAAKEKGDALSEAECYIKLANIYDDLENSKKAIEYGEKALEIAKRKGDTLQESESYIRLANIYYNKNPPKAINYLDNALEIAIKNGHKAVELEYFISLATFSREAIAIEYWEAALEIAKKIGNKNKEALCYRGLGYVYYHLKNFNRAIEYFLNAEKALKITGQSYILRVSIYSYLVLAYEKIEDYENAEKYKKLATNTQNKFGVNSG